MPHRNAGTTPALTLLAAVAVVLTSACSFHLTTSKAARTASASPTPTASSPAEPTPSGLSSSMSATLSAAPSSIPLGSPRAAHGTPDPSAGGLVPEAPAAPTAIRLTQQGAAYFHSPSGNIGCFLLWYGGDRYVDCTENEKDFADPPEPPGGCDLDWAPQFSLHDKATYGACRGDVDGLPTDRVLPYGTAAVNGPVTCVSEQTGITCRNTDTRHGFSVSRETYHLF